MFLMILLHHGVNSKGKEQRKGINRIEPSRVTSCRKPRRKTRVQHQGYNGIHHGRAWEHWGTEEVGSGPDVGRIKT